MLSAVRKALVATGKGRRAQVAEVSKGGMECELAGQVAPGLEPTGS